MHATLTNPAGTKREPVAGNDAIWLQDSPSNLMVINAVIITDRIEIDAVRRAFQTKVLEGDAGQRYRRMTQRVVWVNGRPYWEVDPQFDIARQVVPAPEADLSTTERLQNYVGRAASRPLPDDRPRWQMQHIPEFEQDASAFVVRVHHSIGDGVALISVIFALMEEAQAAAQDSAEMSRQMRGSRGGAAATALRIALAAPVVLVRDLCWWADRHPLHGPPLSGEKQVAWTEPFDLAHIKAVKNHLGSTVNDVLMSCVSGGLARYLQRIGGEVPDTIKVSMPVNIRRPDAPLTLDNKFAAVPLKLPAGIHPTVERLKLVKQAMDALKRSVEPIVVYVIQKFLLILLPQLVSRTLIDFLANKCTCVVTNVPGPQHALMLEGKRVRSFLFWVPQRARIGIGISVLSFSGRVQIGVIADARLLPDPALLVRDFVEEFRALRNL
jgi:diacylglycerol O-acyltransferase